MKLKKMTDFVLNINKLLPKQPDQFFDSWQNRKISLINNYANFLKQPLKLEMFVGEDAIFIFQWEFKEWTESDMENSTIEDLISDDFDSYILNEKAIKQLGL